mgnify:CR=1 FL=1
MIELTRLNHATDLNKLPVALYPYYQDYIHSPEWQAKRQERLEIDNHECKLCFSKQNLHVHHVTYTMLGNEPIKHLLTVCHSCHEIIHNRKFNSEQLY